MRFDVVAIIMEEEGPQLEIIQNAFLMGDVTDGRLYPGRHTFK